MMTIVLHDVRFSNTEAICSSSGDQFVGNVFTVYIGRLSKPHCRCLGGVSSSRSSFSFTALFASSGCKRNC